MRSFLLTLATTLLFSVSTFASAHSSETVSIKVKHQKNVAHGRINVRFAEMVEDSRCPRDVQCIQAGNATVKIRVSRGRRAETLTISTDPRSGKAAFEGYEFRLVGLTPEPRSNIRINPDGYVAKIEVTKS